MLPRLVLLIACIAAAPLRAETVGVDIDGAAITLAVPAGHCPLDRSNATDRTVIETVERAVATSNRVLVAFAECGQLAEVRAGQRRVLDDFGQYMSPLRGGKVDIDSAAFAQRMTEVFKSQGAQLIQGAEAETREKIAAMRIGVRMGENRLLGVLRTDQRASYLGIVQNLGLPDGSSKIQLGIVAMGVVKQRIVSLNLYTPFAEGPSGAATTLKLLGGSVLTYEAMANANAR